MALPAACGSVTYPEQMMPHYPPANESTSLRDPMRMENSWLWPNNDTWMGWPAQELIPSQDEDLFAGFVNEPLPTPPRTAVSPAPEHSSTCNCKSDVVEKYNSFSS